jgi:pimeloyl-ACP methyl ester carboxylesterase
MRLNLAALIGFTMAFAPGPTEAQITERAIHIEVDPAPVVGTLALPPGTGEVPGIVILPGSGPVDRDGNFPGGRNDSLRLLAHGLAARGIATLRIDKRGIGESRDAAPREEQLRFSTYVADGGRWLDRLRAEPRVGRVYLLGHSEGALVATMAAGRVHPRGLILLAGAGAKAGVGIRRQLDAARLPAELRQSAERILSALERRQTVAEVEPALAALFRPSVQGYVISWLMIDPVAELAETKVPTLVVQGTTDLQTSPDDARALAEARSGITLKIIEGMNHVLKAAPADRTANLASYNDPSLPLAPQLIPTIVEFVARK